MEALLSSYPRSRPELPQAHRQSYVEHYRANRSGERGLSRVVLRLESWMHRRIARGIIGGNILEIGAGDLNHVPYHPDASVYDVVEPFEELWRDSPRRARLRHIYLDLAQVPPGQSYDHVISIAVLEHLTDLPSVLANAALLLRPGGSLRAAFPSEGGLLWGLAWRVTTGVEYRLKRGLGYGAIMRHEHVNKADEILALLRYFYEYLDVSRFPLPFRDASFYTAVVARGARLDRCRTFVSERNQVEAYRR